MSNDFSTQEEVDALLDIVAGEELSSRHQSMQEKSALNIGVSSHDADALAARRL